MAIKRARRDTNGIKIAIFFKKFQKFLNNHPGAYLGGHCAMAPLWVARIVKLHRKVSKIEACPPFAIWA